MFSTWKLGRVAGIDVGIHPTLLLMAAFFAWQGGGWSVLLLASVFGCVLLHEFGHALTARRYGIGTRGIVLSPIGGIASLDRVPRDPAAELVITAAGPAVNLAIWAVASVLAGFPAPTRSAAGIAEFFGLLATVNLVLAGFNLLPGFPMDGGRILRALLTYRLGRRQATEIAATVGRVFAVAFPIAMIALGTFSLLHVVLAGFLFLAAGAELASVRAESTMAVGGGRRSDFDAPWIVSNLTVPRDRSERPMPIWVIIRDDPDRPRRPSPFN